MELTVGGRFPPEGLNERRCRAVKLRLSGMKLAEVSAVVELSRGTILASMDAGMASKKGKILTD